MSTLTRIALSLIVLVFVGVVVYGGAALVGDADTISVPTLLYSLACVVAGFVGAEMWGRIWTS